MRGDPGVGGRDGPQASLDRAVGTNQEIEPGEPKNRGESSVPGLADWPSRRSRWPADRSRAAVLLVSAVDA